MPDWWFDLAHSSPGGLALALLLAVLALALVASVTLGVVAVVRFMGQAFAEGFRQEWHRENGPRR